MDIPSLSRQVVQWIFHQEHQPAGKTMDQTNAALTAMRAESSEGIFLGSRNVEPLSSPFLASFPRKELFSIARGVLERNQVLKGAAEAGAEAVAAARLNHHFNRFVGGAAECLLPEKEVAHVGTVRLIFTLGAVTILGLKEGEDWRADPKIAFRVGALRPYVISQEEEQKIDDLVDSQLALLATEIGEEVELV